MNNFQYGALGYGVQEVQLKGSAETLGLALAEVQDRDYLSVTITDAESQMGV